MTDFLWLWESQIAVRGTRPYCVGKLYLRAHLLPLSFADRVSKSFLPYLRASAAPELAIQFPREDRYGCPRNSQSGKRALGPWLKGHRQRRCPGMYSKRQGADQRRV